VAGLDCWICNNAPADSGGHKSKKSDLKAVFGPRHNMSRVAPGSLSGKRAAWLDNGRPGMFR
jgi:hypothetical protein